MILDNGMHLSNKRIYLERKQYEEMTYDSVYNDCGVRSLAMAVHTTYWSAMQLLKGHKHIWPQLKKKGCNGFKFVKLKYGYRSAKQFAEDHPDGRFILYHGGRYSHHYIPCVHGKFWNDTANPVTQIYQAIPE